MFFFLSAHCTEQPVVSFPNAIPLLLNCFHLRTVLVYMVKQQKLSFSNLYFCSFLLWFNPFTGVLVMISSFTLAMGNIGAARKLHFNLLANKLHTPQSFFDTTPIGRIINRFSKDIYVIDETLPSTVLMFLGTFFLSLSTMIVIISSTPFFAIVIVPLTAIYVFVQVLVSGRYFILCAKQTLRFSFFCKCLTLALPGVACSMLGAVNLVTFSFWLLPPSAWDVCDERLLLRFHSFFTPDFPLLSPQPK